MPPAVFPCCFCFCCCCFGFSGRASFVLFLTECFPLSPINLPFNHRLTPANPLLTAQLQRTCLCPRLWQLCFVFGPFIYLPSTQKNKQKGKKQSAICLCISCGRFGDREPTMASRLRLWNAAPLNCEPNTRYVAAVAATVAAVVVAAAAAVLFVVAVD